MVTLAVRTWRTDGTTIVACRLANDADEPRVALLDDRVDGPVHLAPAYRSEEATLQVTVPANATVGTGFATPAEPTETVVELVEEREPSSPNPDAVLADLSDPRPPHGAVVAGETGGEGRKANDEATGGTDESSENEKRAEGEVDAVPALDTIEGRIDRLEAVAAATTVPEAADALAAEGGLGSVRRLDSQVRADRDRLTALADRALALADRAEAVEPRIETLDRLS
jgi:hypothetical protein